MPNGYRHLTESDRFTIQSLLAQGHSQRQVALALGVDPSTITRELQRTRRSVDDPRPYIATFGQRVREQRRKSAGALRRKLGPSFDSPLASQVLHELQQGWSPEQVCGRLREQSPSSEPSAVVLSHETIYAAIYAQPRGELRTSLVKALRQSRGGRINRARGKSRFSAIQDAISISMRPSEVDSRLVPGHWEGDLIKGARNLSAVGTLVERTSRYIMLVKIDALDSLSVVNAFAKRLKRIPPALRKSMTYDRGTEMARHQDLSKRLNLDIFFCDPYRPSQRATNENFNGLVRQYLPKGTDLSTVSDAQLRHIENLLNNRPRKILNFRTPAEVFSDVVQSFV